MVGLPLDLFVGVLVGTAAVLMFAIDQFHSKAPQALSRRFDGFTIRELTTSRQYLAGLGLHTSALIFLYWIFCYLGPDFTGKVLSSVFELVHGAGGTSGDNETLTELGSQPKAGANADADTVRSFPIWLALMITTVMPRLPYVNNLYGLWRKFCQQQARIPENIDNFVRTLRTQPIHLDEVSVAHSSKDYAAQFFVCSTSAQAAEAEPFEKIWPSLSVPERHFFHARFLLWRLEAAPVDASLQDLISQDRFDRLRNVILEYKTRFEDIERLAISEVSAAVAAAAETNISETDEDRHIRLDSVGKSTFKQFISQRSSILDDIDLGLCYVVAGLLVPVSDDRQKSTALGRFGFRARFGIQESPAVYGDVIIGAALGATVGSLLSVAILPYLFHWSGFIDHQFHAPLSEASDIGIVTILLTLFIQVPALVTAYYQHGRANATGANITLGRYVRVGSICGVVGTLLYLFATEAAFLVNIKLLLSGQVVSVILQVFPWFFIPFGTGIFAYFFLNHVTRMADEKRRSFPFGQAILFVFYTGVATLFAATIMLGEHITQARECENLISGEYVYGGSVLANLENSVALSGDEKCANDFAGRHDGQSFASLQEENVWPLNALNFPIATLLYMVLRGLVIAAFIALGGYLGTALNAQGSAGRKHGTGPEQPAPLGTAGGAV